MGYFLMEKWGRIIVVFCIFGKIRVKGYIEGWEWEELEEG